MQYNLSTKTKPTYRARSLDNLLRMGHCAPAVMQTVLEIAHTEQEWLVKLMAGMPGGIGNTGFECGGITSPLVILGLRNSLREMQDGLPLIFDQGHAYCQHFCNENAAPFCKAIQNPRFPVRCIHAVRHSPELLAETLENDNRSAIPAKPPRLKNESAQGFTLNILANAYSLSGQPRRAIRLLEMHNPNYEKVGNKKNIANGLGNVAQQQLGIGVLSAAERNLRIQINLCREVADERSEAVGHQGLGRILSYRGVWQEAEQELATGLKLFEKNGEVQSQSVIWSYRALCFLLMARDETIFDTRKSNNEYRISAIEAAQRALELADETAKPNSGFVYPIRDYIRAYWLLGAAHRANNELTLAEENLSKALNLCRQINWVHFV